MNIFNLIRFKNRLLSNALPEMTGRSAATMFLSPRPSELKDWEHQAERTGKRSSFGGHLSALKWGDGKRKILLMHGWESRASQMVSLVTPLTNHGFSVIAIDGPKHGQSGGDKANPIAFSDAIKTAECEFGPFYGAIGHSLGGTAIALAMESGVRFERCALIASPSCFYDVLFAFANYIGLSIRARNYFINCVEQRAASGRSSKTLDVARIFSEIKPESLLIHSRDDKEVQYDSVIKIKQAYPNVHTLLCDDLGHRKVIRDTGIAIKVASFIDSGTI
jgi:pimeloyl-ACP methyl ester carboxylesterase